jgi:aconitate hydratase
MGVLPLQFAEGATRRTLLLRGDETFDVHIDLLHLHPSMEATLVVHRADGSMARAPLQVRIDTPREARWYRAGGVMPYVLDKILAVTSSAEQRP